MEKEKLISKSTIKSIGFSEKLIKELLPEPILKDNPYYKCAAKMQLWKEAEVLEAMKNQKFIDYQKSRELRSDSALERAEKKRKETFELVDDFLKNITIKKLPMDELWKETVADKECFDNNCRYNYDYFEFNDYNSADKETKKRWMRNYVRHNLTEYEEDLEQLYRKIGKQEAYEYFKEELMKKIKKVYPKIF